MASWPGMVAVGNLDLLRRPIVHNPDGSISTVLSITVESEGVFVLLPTVLPSPARIVSNSEAISHFLSTGEHLGKFDTNAHAETYALALHDQQAGYYASPQPDQAPLYLVPRGIVSSWIIGMTPATGPNRSRALVSTDLVSWIEVNPMLATPSLLSCVDVEWSPEQRQWVALGGAATTGVASWVSTSPDGVTWTPHGRIFSLGVSGSQVIWVAELGLWVATGRGTLLNTTGEIATSPDGVTWTLRSHPLPALAVSVAWSPELGLLVVGGTGEVFVGVNLATSPNGVNWTLRSNPLQAVDAIWNRIAWGGGAGKFVGMGFTDPFGIGHITILTSPNGITWTSQAAAFYNTGVGADEALVWADGLGLFVAGKNVPSLGVALSSDGINWTHVPVPTGGTSPVVDLAWSQERGLLVAISDAPFLIWQSPDGVNWTTRSHPLLTTEPLCVGYGAAGPYPETPPGDDSGGSGSHGNRRNNIPLGVLGATLVKRKQRSGPN